MSFVLQRVTGRVLVLNQVSGNVLRIGRGTNAELRSENPAVSLDHATIEGDDAGYTITDKGSITGTYVNKKPVESMRLAKGDVIEIGDLHIEVQLADPARPLFLRVVSTTPTKAKRAPGEGLADDDDEAPHASAGGALKAPKFDFASAFRLRRTYLTKLSLMALMAIIALAVVAEVTLPENQTVFMPGGLSSAHSRKVDPNTGSLIGKNCRACHDPWHGVVDQRCNDCHRKEPHAETQAEAPPCLSCHAEHRGAPKLTLFSDVKCVSCHSNLQAHVKPGSVVQSAIAHIAAFGDLHPDFTWPADRDVLRFNHKLHLQPGGIRNGEGKRETLPCKSCHKLVVDARGEADPKPLKFATDCQRCHRLTFDARFPNTEAPHGGDPGLVVQTVLATYAGNRDLAGKSPEEVRRILTTHSPSNVDMRAVQNAEQVVKVKCGQCHDVRGDRGQLAVTPPVFRTRWLTRVTFTHTKHSEPDCESCHAAARQSTKTVDVLMPSRKDCVSCHAAHGKQPAEPCVTCHKYHERSKRLLTKMSAGATPGKPGRSGGPLMQNAMEGGPGMLGTILLYAIVLLLLVVLVPVGIAIFQRLRISNEDRASQRPPSANVPPAKIPPLNPGNLPPPAAPPAPAAPPTQAFAPSSAIRKTDPQGVAPPAPAATELVQWYGMISCTSGPLEGQRFVIEEDGFYIGRDSTLSQVVVADGRVSKRHVRIVPRDGKVHAIDQGSTNGTFLGSTAGQRITDVQLKRGDVIVLADNVASFVYQI